MLEEEVRQGRAIVVLQAPRQHRRDADTLKALFHAHLIGTAAGDIAHCVLNDEAEEVDRAEGSSTRGQSAKGAVRGEACGDDDTEVAAVEFFSPEGVGVVLERLQEASTVKRGPSFELRRGYLTLGTARLLVEGVAIPATDSDDNDSSSGGGDTGRDTNKSGTNRRDAPQNADGDDPTQCPVAAVPPAPIAKVGDNAAVATRSREEEPSRSLGVPLTGKKGSPEDQVQHQQRQEQEEGAAASFSLRVAVMDFKLLFGRRDAHGHLNGGPPPQKDFPLSPYMVLQLLRAVGLTPVALRLGSRFSISNNQTPVFRFLVEFHSEAEVAQSIRELDDVVVDLKSPGLANGGGASTEAALQVYARRPQLERFPDWLEHVGDDPCKGLTGRLRRAPHDRNFLYVGGPDEANRRAVEERLGKPFDHAWVASQDHRQQHQRQQQQQDQSQGHRGNNTNAEGPPSASGFAQSRLGVEGGQRQQHPNSFLQPPARQQQLEEERGRRSRERSDPYVAADDSARGGKHPRTSSEPSTPTPAPAPARLAQAYSMVQAAYPQTTAVPTAVMPSQPFFVAAATVPAVPHTPNPYLQFLQLQQQQQQQQQLLAAALQQQKQQQQQQASTSREPAYGQTHDAQGALPAGWRAVYSEQYHQTYYVFHDAATGHETTTWTRPA